MQGSTSTKLNEVKNDENQRVKEKHAKNRREKRSKCERMFYIVWCEKQRFLFNCKWEIDKKYIMHGQWLSLA